MMENSAAYMFTQSKASDQLAIEYLQVEKARTLVFAQAWDAVVEFRRNTSRLRQIQVPEGLREEHVLAILAYSRADALYSQFNEALRLYGASDSVYAEKFHFKAFHYLLSVALDRLRIFSSAPGITYRGMKLRSKAREGSKMKFGYFASSSRDIQIARGYGNATLLTIKSLKGVDVARYSFFPLEKEVLIAPDEVFKVTRSSSGDKGVEISLEAEGEDGIAVRVERGEEGQLRVVRSVRGAIFVLVLWCAVVVRFL
ncbi:NAD(P)(+)--arginine ADP-ribosyltransferase 2-like [Rhinoraja longicauda]